MQTNLYNREAAQYAPLPSSITVIWSSSWHLFFVVYLLGPRGVVSIQWYMLHFPYVELFVSRIFVLHLHFSGFLVLIGNIVWLSASMFSEFNILLYLVGVSVFPLHLQESHHSFHFRFCLFWGLWYLVSNIICSLPSLSCMSFRYPIGCIVSYAVLPGHAFLCLKKLT